MIASQPNPRKVILFNLITLDGFFEGPNQDISWHNVDEEFNDFAIEQLQTMGAIIFGRVTYEGMASYWPTEVALADDAVVAGQMNSMPKIVFSKTLDKAYWSHTTLIKGDLAQEYVARHFSGMSRRGHFFLQICRVPKGPLPKGPLAKRPLRKTLLANLM